MLNMEANDDQVNPTLERESNYLHWWLHELITITTFLLVFILGLSLTTAGIFKDYVDIVGAKTGRYKLSLWASLGLSMMIYSTIGLCLNYIGRLKWMQFYCCLVNILAILASLLRTLNHDTSVALTAEEDK